MHAHGEAITSETVDRGPSTAQYLTGQVIEADGDICLLSVGHSLREARRALSCLVELEPGDTVAMLITPADGHGGAPLAHVVAVLYRATQAPLRVRTDRPLSIESTATLSLRGRAMGIVSEQTSLTLGKLRLVAGDVVAETGTVRFLSRLLHTVLDSMHLVAQRSFRHIAQSDHQRCGYLDLEAEQLVQIRARNTMITSQQLTRVDGAQIHVG